MVSMAEIKTKPTAESVTDFINKILDEEKRKDSFLLLDMMHKASGEEAILWGNSLIGFGKKRFKSPATGREVDWFRIGFSPRKANLSLYLMGEFKRHDDLLKQLGKHKIGAGCLYVNKLADVDQKILIRLIDSAWKQK
jgi:hypothetical protein